MKFSDLVSILHVKKKDPIFVEYCLQDSTSVTPLESHKWKAAAFEECYT